MRVAWLQNDLAKAVQDVEGVLNPTVINNNTNSLQIRLSQVKDTIIQREIRQTSSSETLTEELIGLQEPEAGQTLQRVFEEVLRNNQELRIAYQALIGQKKEIEDKYSIKSWLDLVNPQSVSELLYNWQNSDYQGKIMVYLSPGEKKAIPEKLLYQLFQSTLTFYEQYYKIVGEFTTDYIRYLAIKEAIEHLEAKLPREKTNQEVLQRKISKLYQDLLPLEKLYGEFKDRLLPTTLENLIEDTFNLGVSYGVKIPQRAEDIRPNYFKLASLLKNFSLGLGVELSSKASLSLSYFSP